MALKGKYLLIKEDVLKVVQDLEEGTKKKDEKRREKDKIYIDFFRGRRRRVA